MNDKSSGAPTSGGIVPSQLPPARFLEIFGGVYEHSPWVAQGALTQGMDTGADTPDGLATVLAGVVAAAPYETKLELLRAHPDLAGKLAVAGDLTAASQSEQASAALDQCTPEELVRFQELNDAYKRKFAFPFILAVRGYQRREILEIFEQRLGNDPEAEFDEAMRQVYKIAGLRIQNYMAAQTG